VLRRSRAWIAIALVTACRPATPPSSAPPEPAAAAPAPQAVLVEPPPVAAHVAHAVTPPWSLSDIPRIVAVQSLVHDAARRHGVDPDVMNAIIWHESKFHVKAKGPGGAAGLMQLMPSTSKSLAKRLGRSHRPYEAEFNVEAGAFLLSRLLVIFDGDLRLAIAGYGLGHGAVKKRLAAGEPLPEKTERFIAKVERWSVAFATLPCPGGRARDADGGCAGAAASDSPAKKSAR
jgi:soluble lytic murein transglycosylase-like protein